MPESTNHNKQHSHSEWRKNKNRRKYRQNKPIILKASKPTKTVKKSQESKPGLIRRAFKRIFRTQSR